MVQKKQEVPRLLFVEGNNAKRRNPNREEKNTGTESTTAYVLLSKV
jgi:hypothetical protein